MTTVNNRLHAARAQLKRRTLTMVKDTLGSERLPDDFAARIGRIVRAREGVVEVLFDPARLPDPLTELTVSDQARRRAIRVQVVQLLRDGLVRCVPMAPSEPLHPGMTVLSSGRRTEDVMSREVLDGAVRGLSESTAPADRLALLETGIKVIDVLCPLIRGGTMAIAGEYRAGTVVVAEELCWRLRSEPGGVSIFAFVAPGPSASFQEVWEKEGYTGGTAGTVQTFYFAGEAEWTAERLARLPEVDAVIRLSQALGALGIYPTIDAIVSRSRALDAGLVGEEHAALAARIRDALVSARGDHEGPRVPPAGSGDVALRRVRMLWQFFAQPFFVAEPYTKRPRSFVSRADALRGCREILDGAHDDLPDDACYFTGGIDEIRARAGRP